MDAWRQWFDDLDFNVAAVTWCSMFAIAAIVTGWNCVDSWRDWMTNIDENEAPEYIAGSRWFFRQDFFKAIALVLLMIGGVYSVFRQAELARLMLFAAGVVITLNQVMNRIDRIVVKRLADSNRAERRRQRMHELEV